ncbi:MAG TPA: pyridoxal-phosphate dependent enzyme, partial [archaeon]|nr:pyridoxal-phosphate dependent enzyme [archaeon]
MSILNNIGNTQLVEIRGVKVKLEYLNPSGSVKDRIVKYIVEYAERRGLLKRGYTLVEASTGNTGIAVSFVGAVKGYKVHIFIP